MKIEILYPEMAYLFGDNANVLYLEQSLPEAEFIKTAKGEAPKFISEEINLVYLGALTESNQEKAIKLLTPYKEDIKKAIDKGTVFLFTGNALEIMGDYILDDDGRKISCLGIFEYYAKRDYYHRHNSACLCEFEDMKIMGFKTQFTMCYPKTDANGLFKVTRGIGMNEKTLAEGIRVNNFFGTYLVGPLLLLNPEFTKYLLKLMGANDPSLAFEKEAMDAYKQRYQDFLEKIPVKPEKYKKM